MSEPGAVQKADLFISYAHIDDKALPPEKEGWISRFHVALQAFLEERLGRRVEIWRDRELQGNDVFGDEIIDQLSNAAVLVSVITPRYINSDWCTREIREFCALAEKTSSFRVGNQARVVKVLKTPVDTQEPLPAPVRDLLGFEFFQWLEDGTPVELDRAYGESFAQAYNLKIANLAWALKKLFEALESEAGSHDADTNGKTSTKPPIYLAECSFDRKPDREALAGELQRLGYTVLPDRELPRDEAGYVEAVDALLSECKLAVHLIGAKHGAVPDGPSEKSTVELQNEVAARRSKSSALRRVIWLPEGTQSEQADQQAFLETLHTDAEAQFGADLITGDFESLKTTIYATLKRLEDASANGDRPEVEETGAKLIYLICTSKDRPATVPIRKYLHEQGFEVELPAFDGDAAAVRAVHEQLLTECEAVLLYYGAGDEAWKRAMDNELRKLSGYRGDKPLAAAATYLADPPSDDKADLLAMGESDLIDGRNGSAESQLSAFAQAVSSGAEAR